MNNPATNTIGGFFILWLASLAATAIENAGIAVFMGQAPIFHAEMIAPLVIVATARAAIFWAFAAASPFTGAGLWLRLAGLAVGVQIALTAIEAYFFGVFLPDFTLRVAASAFLSGAAALAAISFAASRVFGAGPGAERAPARATGAGAWIWRLALTAFVYLVVYFAAGGLAWRSPELREFYGDGLELDAGRIALVQIGRGLIWALLAWLAAEIWGRRGLLRALMTGFAFAVFMGFLLLYPSPYFPDAVRRVHLIEVSTSNFVFGVLASFIMGALARTRMQ